MISSPSETSSGVYGRIFWLAYLANSALVMANALTFRFAELVHYLGGSESAVGDIVALGTLIAVAVRLSVSHVLDDYGTRRLWPICSLLFIAGCGLFIGATQFYGFLYIARIAYYVGLTGMFACSMTHIQNHVPSERRTEIIGNLGSSGFVGMILGSNLGDWILRSVHEPRLQFLILFGGAGLIGLFYLAIVIALTWDEEAHGRPASPTALRLMFRFWPGTVVLAAMTMGLGVTATQTFLTRYATSQQIEICNFRLCVSVIGPELEPHPGPALDAGARLTGACCRPFSAGLCHGRMAVYPPFDRLRIWSCTLVSRSRLARVRRVSQRVSWGRNGNYSGIHRFWSTGLFANSGAHWRSLWLSGDLSYFQWHRPGDSNRLFPHRNASRG